MRLFVSYYDSKIDSRTSAALEAHELDRAGNMRALAQVEKLDQPSYPAAARYGPPIALTNIWIRSRMFEMEQTIELICGRHAWPSPSLQRLCMAIHPECL